MAQQMMFDLVLNLADGEEIDINALKIKAPEFAAKVTKDEEYDGIRDQLKAEVLLELKAPAPEKKEEAAPPPSEGADKKDDKSKDKKDEKHEAKEVAEAKA
jgi:hypothetical protein